MVRRRLESLFPSYRRKLSLAFSELSQIIQFARALGLTKRILVRPTLNRNSDFFRAGFMFECVRQDKRKDVIATGGRYDSLLVDFRLPDKLVEHLRLPPNGVKAYAVGMCIAIE